MNNWVAYSPSNPIPEEVQKRREARRGRHLGTVTVEVYEHEVHPQVAWAGELPEDFKAEAVEIVLRARDALTDWR
jgi:hypothetical protein